MHCFYSCLKFKTFIYLLLLSGYSYAQSFTETFTNINSLTASAGWSIINRSTTIGDSTWRQGENQTLPGGFLSFDNASPNGFDYALCDFESGTDVDTLSVWLITPTISTLSNGDTFSFYTRTITGSFSPDRLQVRLSTNGNSSNVGATAFSVGDFTYLLQDINPNLNFGGYPETWTLYTTILSGLPAGNFSGRFAFRYFAEDAGPFGSNSYAVGVDVVRYADFIPLTSTLTTDAVNPQSYCPSTSISVPYNSVGYTFNTGNVFTIQLSDAVGSFSNPVNIGSLTSTATSGTVIGSIPLLTTPGNNYRVRIVSSNPTATGSPNNTDLLIRSLPAAGITPVNPSFCQGSSVLLTASGGNGYVWSSGGSNASENVNAQGTYTVTVTGVGNCTASASVSVSQSTLPVASITPANPSFCQGSSVLLTASGGNSYTWSSGGSSASENVNTQGTYAVTVTGAGNCTASASVSVAQNAPPVVGIIANGPTTFCEGDSVQLSATGGVSYLWSTGVSTNSLTVDSSGSYIVTATDLNGCSASTVQAITVNSNPSSVINTSGSTTICPGDSVTLTAPLGTAYVWSNGSIQPSVVASIADTYTVTVTNTNNCTAMASATVTVQTTANTPINANGPTVICQGESVTLTATNGDTYLWSTGSNSQSVTASSSGMYSVTVTFSGGCSATASQQVSVNSIPVATINASAFLVICPSQVVTLTAGGNGTYEWSTGSTTSSINIQSPGQYILTVTNNFNCSASVAISFTQAQNPIATITANGPTSFCSGDSVALTADGGASYTWSGGQNTPAVNASTSGTYTVTVTDVNGCTATTSQLVEQVTPVVSIIADGPTTFCVGGSVTLTADSGSTYLWSNGATTQSITTSIEGTYSVTTTNFSNCTASAQQIVSIELNPSTSITVSGSGVLCADGGQEILTAGSGISYAWSTGETTASIEVSTSGTYTVTVFQAGNCSASSSQVINQSTPIQITATTTGSTGSDGSLNVTVTGGNSPISYSWNNGATSEDISSLSPGIYTLTVTDANQCSATASFNILTVGIKENYEMTELQVFPNPSTTYMIAKLNMQQAAEGVLKVTDYTGRVVYTHPLAAGMETSITLSCDSWAAGMYQVMFITNRYTATRRVVVVK